MVADGADIIDIGGESTRPGATRSTPDEELRRVLPVIERLARASGVPISIDTYKAAVARDGACARARRSSTTSAACSTTRSWRRSSPSTGAALVLMHNRGTVAARCTARRSTTTWSARCVAELRGRRSSAAEAAGIAREAIDPRSRAWASRSAPSTATTSLAGLDRLAELGPADPVRTVAQVVPEGGPRRAARRRARLGHRRGRHRQRPFGAHIVRVHNVGRWWTSCASRIGSVPRRRRRP